MSSRTGSPVLTMPEAARWLGIRGKYGSQWLRRYLLRRERDLGTGILLRSGRNPKRARYRISIANLRRHCPELIDPTDEIARTLKSMVLAQKRERGELLEQLEEMRADIGVLIEAMRRRG